MGLIKLTLFICGILVLTGCEKSADSPSLDEAVSYMQGALLAHDGHRLEQFASDVKLINRLEVKQCKLFYTVTNYETVRYELSDIDPSTFEVKTIGPAWWVVFRTRDFHRSVHYADHFPDATKNLDYDQDNGGFSLDSQEVATSFGKALKRAATLCGAKNSTF